MRRSLLFVVVCCAAAQQQPVFHSQTRLVEVDVVIRDKHGPVTGLTKDDFTLYDCKDSERDLDHAGSNSPCRVRKQPIAVFREVNTGPDATPAGSTPSPQPPGTVSNRLDSSGKPIGAATVVVIDQLNTPFDLKGHQRLELTKFLAAVGDHERIAVYSLGKDLHLLQDFTSDPKKLVEAVTRIDPGDQLNFGGGSGDAKIEGAENIVIACIKKGMTEDAVKAIVHHTEGVPGRKNLLWLGQGFRAFNSRADQCGPPIAGPVLGQANFATSPVLVRSLQPTGMASAQTRRMRAPTQMVDLDIQYYNRLRGEALGGTGFDDASELSAALRKAQSDSSHYYVLGFYPAESDLGGGTHQLTVEMPRALSRRSGFDLRYRQTYRAAMPGTKGNAEENGEPLSLLDIFRAPMDATAVGLTAAIEPDAVRPGARVIAMTIDLADIQLQREGDRWIGSLQVAMRLESGQAVTEPITDTVHFNLTDAELEARKRAGLQVTLPLPANNPSGVVHVVVQGTANGAAGSLHVPIAGNP